MDKIADIPRVIAPVLFILAKVGKLDKHKLYDYIKVLEGKYSLPVSIDFIPRFGLASGGKKH